LDDEEGRSGSLCRGAGDIVTLNVGGTKFQTTVATLTGYSGKKDSFLASLLASADSLDQVGTRKE
jgi:hypothetical protein